MYIKEESIVTTLTAKKARQNFFDLLKKASRGHGPIKIAFKEGGVVLISEEDYERLLETLELRSTPGVLKGLREARKDIKKLSLKLKGKLYDILTEVAAKDPYQGKKLIGDLGDSYSHNLTYQDRILYSINRKKKIVYFERTRTHYGD